MIRTCFIRASLRALFRGAGVVALVLGVMSCSDDPASPQPQGSSNIFTFHANHGLTASKFNFRIDTATIASLTYGESAKTMAQNGSRTVKIFNTSGNEVASVGANLDSSKSNFVVFSGDDSNREGFNVNSAKIAPSGGNCAIRVVHASNNAGEVTIKVNSMNGLSFTTRNLSYKSGTDYVELPVALTDSLLILKPGAADVLLSVQTKTLLSALKSYTIVLYGSTSPGADPSVKFASKLIPED